MNKQYARGKLALLSVQASGQGTQDNGGGGDGVEPPKLN